MKEKFTEIYKKNAERMETAKTMYKIAMKQGNKELARRFLYYIYLYIYI